MSYKSVSEYSPSQGVGTRYQITSGTDVLTSQVADLVSSIPVLPGVYNILLNYEITAATTCGFFGCSMIITAAGQPPMEIRPIILLLCLIQVLIQQPQK